MSVLSSPYMTLQLSPCHTSLLLELSQMKELSLAEIDSQLLMWTPWLMISGTFSKLTMTTGLEFALLDAQLLTRELRTLDKIQ